MWLILVLVLFVVLGFGSIFLLLYMRPAQDNLPILTALFAFLALLVSGMFGLLNTKKIDETHHLVNSRMEELSANREKVAEGLGYNRALREAETERVTLVQTAQKQANEIVDRAAERAREIVAVAVKAAQKVKVQKQRPLRRTQR